jgi:hypothetical protein
LSRLSFKQEITAFPPKATKPLKGEKTSFKLESDDTIDSKGNFAKKRAFSVLVFQ